MSQVVFVGLIRKFCMVYLDDIIFYSNNIKEHMDHLYSVLEHFQTHCLRIAPKKYAFIKTTLDFLSHTIHETQTKPMKKHLK